MPLPPAEPLGAERVTELHQGYHTVARLVQEAKDATAAQFPQRRHVRLVAVSKTHHYPVLQAVYDAGCRVFGENYVQEIVAKAPHLPQDIEWHFVGHLQSNKVKELLSTVVSLDTVESVDSEKIAKKLNEGVEKYRQGRILNVMIQVNTSGEESKSGVEPSAAAPLCAYVQQHCPLLRVTGLMTIGMPDYTSRPENFECLTQCRAAAAAAMGLSSPDELDLSMGMSGDYKAAIAMGSSNVRVGTAIFGARTYAVPVPAVVTKTPPPEQQEGQEKEQGQGHGIQQKQQQQRRRSSSNKS